MLSSIIYPHPERLRFARTRGYNVRIDRTLEWVIYMSAVILITGKVKFRINLDPTIWIFDKRRFSLSDRFDGVEGLAMELKPFFENAEPEKDVTQVICHRSQGEPVTLSYEEASSAYLCFAKDNKPIRDGGPALLYLADGSNKDQPLSHLTEFELI